MTCSGRQHISRFRVRSEPPTGNVTSRHYRSSLSGLLDNVALSFGQKQKLPRDLASVIERRASLIVDPARVRRIIVATCRIPAPIESRSGQPSRKIKMAFSRIVFLIVLVIVGLTSLSESVPLQFPARSRPQEMYRCPRGYRPVPNGGCRRILHLQGSNWPRQNPEWQGPQYDR